MSSWDTDSSSDSIPLIVYANNNRLPGSNDSVAESDSEDNESIQDNSDTSSGDVRYFFSFIYLYCEKPALFSNTFFFFFIKSNTSCLIYNCNYFRVIMMPYYSTLTILILGLIVLH